ncbi:hypothetical protein [Massilia agri]|uniref:Uncharacterized protein n=1 Tax=Massilia agri TaxID=1886785 RepID=A0ABT2APM0_9BURK|nr:hypothetical protein [Massilia agri]MCS0598130.1 hypothetical protein [Massilia agri]
MTRFFLRGFPHSVLAACILGGLFLGRTESAIAASDAVVRTTQQGMHSWKTAAGRLFMVAGTYQDTTAYRRSVSFCFQENDQGDWLQVPIVESKVDLTNEWTTASLGETTLRDAAVVPLGKDVYLIIANRHTDSPTIVVKRYRLSAAGNDYPDGPAMLFVPVSTATYQVAKLKSVEAVLDRELAAPSLSSAANRAMPRQREPKDRQ